MQCRQSAGAHDTPATAAMSHTGQLDSVDSGNIVTPSAPGRKSVKSRIGPLAQNDPNVSGNSSNSSFDSLNGEGGRKTKRARIEPPGEGHVTSPAPRVNSSNSRAIVNNVSNTNMGGNAPPVECNNDNNDVSNVNDGENSDEGDLSLEKEAQFDKLNTHLGLDEVFGHAMQTKNKMNFDLIYFLMSIMYIITGLMSSSALQARSCNKDFLFSNMITGAYNFDFLQSTCGNWTMFTLWSRLSGNSWEMTYLTNPMLRSEYSDLMPP